MCDFSTKEIIRYKFAVVHFTYFVTYSVTRQSARMCLFRDHNVIVVKSYDAAFQLLCVLLFIFLSEIKKTMLDIDYRGFGPMF